MAPEHAADLGKISEKLDALIKVVGEESDDGKSGTGLFGEVRRTSAQLADLRSLRDKGLGLVLGVLLLGIIIFGGIKQAMVTAAGILK